MRAYLIALLLVVAPAVASAQQAPSPCRTEGQFKIFGCMDLPVDESTISRSDPAAIQGWSLSCYTSQRPTVVEVWQTWSVTGWRRLDPSEYTITWNGFRPDVAAYYRLTCNTLSPFWGYAIQIHPNALELGRSEIALRFFDPSIGIGVNDQRKMFTIVP